METSLQNGKKTIRPKEGHVRKVREDWRSFEDHNLATKLQNNEFDSHYHHNRSERQQMRTDVPMSKQEQRLEDTYAEEYWEQVRRDREKDDQKLALELQEKIDLELKLEKQQVAETDEEYARRIQEKEEVGLKRRREELTPSQDEGAAREMQEYLKSIGDELPDWEGAIPAGLHIDGWNTMRLQRRRGHTVNVPQYFDQRQQMEINRALEKEDAIIAQEEQDKYLARWLHRQDKKVVKEEELYKETLDNHRNMARSSQHDSADLISFDEPPSTNNNPHKIPPPRPPQPNLQRNGNVRIPKGAVRVLPPPPNT